MTLWTRVLAGVLAACIGLGSCAGRPALDQIAQGSSVGGPDTAAVLEKLKREAPDADILTRHLAVEEAVTDAPLRPGNRVTLLRDGGQTFDAIWKAIGAARDHVNLEYFIFEDVAHNDKSIVDLLIEKSRAGVQVNLIYDSIGSQDTPREVFERLREAGVLVLEANPLNPLKSPRARIYSPNDRDHRKILVVDGKLGVTGGINISKTYASSGSAGERQTGKAKRPEEMPWRDTAILIEGPAAADFQQLFFEMWEDQHGGEIDKGKYFPKLERRADGETVRVIGSRPNQDIPAFYATLLSAIRSAEQRIWLTNSYFAPTPAEADELKAAAHRGVDVRLLLSGESDAPKMQDAGRSYYADLLEAGIRIFELQGAILHAKTAVVDGVWSVVGSSNIDARSVVFNTEVDAVVLGRETGREMEALFEADLQNARAIDPNTWADRSLWQKVKERFWRTWAPLF
jgi:cardiolipin synthase A/B